MVGLKSAKGSKEYTKQERDILQKRFVDEIEKKTVSTLLKKYAWDDLANSFENVLLITCL